MIEHILGVECVPVDVINTKGHSVRVWDALPTSQIVGRGLYLRPKIVPFKEYYIGTGNNKCIIEAVLYSNRIYIEKSSYDFLRREFGNG